LRSSKRKRIPVAAKLKMGILIPTFSFESGTSGKGEIGSEMNTPIDPEMRITKVESKLDVLKAKYSRPFFDIDASYTLLVSDLTKLNEKVRVFSSQLGYSRNKGKGLKGSVIGSIQGITAQVQQFSEFKNRITSQLANLTQNQEVMKRSMDDLTDEFGVHKGPPFSLNFGWTQPIRHLIQLVKGFVTSSPCSTGS